MREEEIEAREGGARRKVQKKKKKRKKEKKKKKNPGEPFGVSWVGGRYHRSWISLVSGRVKNFRYLCFFTYVTLKTKKKSIFFFFFSF
jgi:hypothetical protein